MATIDIEVPQRTEEWLEDILWKYDIELEATYRPYLPGEHSIWALSGAKRNLQAFLEDLMVLASNTA